MRRPRHPPLCWCRDNRKTSCGSCNDDSFMVRVVDINTLRVALHRLIEAREGLTDRTNRRHVKIAKMLIRQSEEIVPHKGR